MVTLQDIRRYMLSQPLSSYANLFSRNVGAVHVDAWSIENEKLDDGVWSGIVKHGCKVMATLNVRLLKSKRSKRSRRKK